MCVLVADCSCVCGIVFLVLTTGIRAQALDRFTQTTLEVKKKNTYLLKNKPWSRVSVTVAGIASRVSEPAAASTAATVVSF